MSKETFYFSHDYNARSDAKIKKLIAKHGYAGYGLYWAIVEDLYQNANALQTDYECIAYDMRTDVNIIKSVIEDFNLFQIEDGFFGSLSVQRRIEERDAKSQKARESAFYRWNKDKNDANAMRTQCDSNAKKESKVKDSKEKEIDYIYSIYPSRCPTKNTSTGKTIKNKDKIKLLLEKYTSDELVKKINDYVNECKMSRTFIKNFGTFLNNIPDDIVEAPQQQFSMPTKDEPYRTKARINPDGSIQFI